MVITSQLSKLSSKFFVSVDSTHVAVQKPSANSKATFFEASLRRKMVGKYTITGTS